MPQTHPTRWYLHRPRRNAAFVLLAALAAFGGVRLVTHDASAQGQAAPAAPPAPRVTVAPVEQKLVTEYEELTGRIDSLDTVELRARVSGHLEQVHFQAGQLVHKGDVLFSIDPRWYRAQFDLANAKVEEAKAQADVADREAKRAKELLAANALSSEEADARVSRALAARAALDSAEAVLASARLDLEYTEVRSPIDGRISRALVTPGNLVSGAPGSATKLATIVSVDEAYAYADVDEDTLLRFNRLLRENRLSLVNGRVPVRMQLADESGYPREGYIESADNRLNPETGSLVLRMVFPNADKALVPGLFARVQLPVSPAQPALLVSERAVGTDQSQKFVLAVADDNKVVYRTVKLGGTYEDKRVVRSGLNPGDRVIVNGLQRVRPGMAVQPELAADSVPSAATVASK